MIYDKNFMLWGWKIGLLMIKNWSIDDKKLIMSYKNWVIGYKWVTKNWS